MRLVQLVDSAGVPILINADLIRMMYADGVNLTRVSFQPNHSVLVKGSLSDLAAKLTDGDRARFSAERAVPA
jgi:hypothetical protein